MLKGPLAFGGRESGNGSLTVCYVGVVPESALQTLDNLLHYQVRNLRAGYSRVRDFLWHFNQYIFPLKSTGAGGTRGEI